MKGGAGAARLLTDEEWAFFEPFVIETGPFRGRPPGGHRRVLDAIFWVARTGTPWRDLPPELGNWNSVHRQYRRWTTSGPWDELLQVLADGGGDADALQMIDSTIVRPITARLAQKGTHRQGLGCLHGGFSTKVHLRTDAYGLPISLTLMPGEAHDSTAYDVLMEERDNDPGILLADRGYDSDAIRQDVRDPGGQPEIPTKRNRRIQHSVQQLRYALGNRIERCINRLKNCRRVATRYDKTAGSFLGFVQLAAIRLWISFAHAV
ncbi:IS5 family transposase [Pseudoroseomonas oryzae]|uniref:IS5 family transposase n=1 Tax=Teichococcus oryzae TaxID=1608942 RepID=A0A5B2TAW3_9PROT|nr:IS5 family transposase [Pseudoroseomonas oryzae]KAA2211235.1 IS5 family transposase [Pseudoroseomonas oryzae]